MDDMINTQPGSDFTNPLAGNPYSYDCVTQAPAKQEINQQTYGGSMCGMPAEAQAKMKEAEKPMPKAQDVAGNQKVFNQVTDDRKSIYTPYKPDTQAIFKKKEEAPAVTAPAASAEEAPAVNPDEINPDSLPPELTGIKEEFEDFVLPKEDQKTFGSNMAALGQAYKDGDKEAQKEITDSYFNRAEQELQKKADSKWQLYATLASIGLTIVSGGIIPPINFIKLTKQDDAMTKWNSLLQEKGSQEGKPVNEMRGDIQAGREVGPDNQNIKNYAEARTEVTSAEQGQGSNLSKKEMENSLNILTKQLKLENELAKDFMRAQTEESKKSQIDLLEKMKNNTISINDAATQNQAGLLADTAKQWGIPLTKDGLVDMQRAMVGESTFSKYSGQITQLAVAAANTAASLAK